MLNEKTLELFKKIDKILTDNLFEHNWTSDGFEHHYYDDENEVIFDPVNEIFIIKNEYQSMNIDNLGTINEFTVSQLLIQFGVK